MSWLISADLLCNTPGSQETCPQSTLRKWEPGTLLGGSSKGALWQLRATPKRDHIPGSPGHAWGLNKREAATLAEGSKLQCGEGMARLRAFCGSHHLSVATNYRSRANQPPTASYSCLSRAHRPQGNGCSWAKVPPGWLWGVKGEALWWMLNWNTISHQDGVCQNQLDKIHFLLGGKTANSLASTRTSVA